MSAERCGAYIDYDGDFLCSRPIDHDGPCLPYRADVVARIDALEREIGAVASYLRDSDRTRFHFWPDFTAASRD